MDEPEKGDLVTPCMGVYKAKIQSDGSLEKLRLTILVRRDFHNGETIGYTLAPTESIRTLNYLLKDDTNHKSRVNQLDLIGTFIPANGKHRIYEVGQ